MTALQGNIIGYASSVVRRPALAPPPSRRTGLPNPLPRLPRALPLPLPFPPPWQWIDYFCSYITSDLSWRVPLLMQSVIGVVLALGTLFLPESPRWLLDTDQDEEGMGVLADLHGDGDPEDERAQEEFREIKEGVLAEVSPRLVSLSLPLRRLCRV